MTFQELQLLFFEISQEPTTLRKLHPIGMSRDGRPIHGYMFGSGSVFISLIAGCHADEPVGPELLAQLINYLSSLSENHPLLRDYYWSIIPHANPDGQEINNQWWEKRSEGAELISYLQKSKRELPGEDIEFGFPRNDSCSGARVENKVMYEWWHSQKCSFDLHASLHGMAFAAGPWYLIDEAWRNTISFIKEECTRTVRQKGYTVHDIERNGEKGFYRLGKGFCTRPDSENMRAFFLEKGDTKTADKFYPSSMEVMRRISDDCLTLVSEMPLFITPGVGKTLGPPDPIGVTWKERIAHWRATIDSPKNILEEAALHGLSAMPINDQKFFQWHLIASSIEQIRLKRITTQ